MATDRLRRKLRDLPSETVSNLTQNDKLCAFGTPLPDLTSRKIDPNEHKPIHLQEARDAQGRRRFHGAFTGGFSAGYFNTVGSKEGWTPSSFRSSRADKNRKVGDEKDRGGLGGKVEDFMDEEDLADYKAAQAVSTTTCSTFGDSQLAGLRAETVADPLAKTLFGKDIGVSQQDALGFQLMRRMGWKDGQGLGPRIDTVRKARLLDLISNGAQVSSGSNLKLEDMNRLYAPPATSVVSISSHPRGRAGLGFVDDTLTLHQVLQPGYKRVSQPSNPAEEGKDEVWPEDARPLPPGFHIARESAPAEPPIPTAEVPSGWQPDPTRIWKCYRSQPEVTIKATKTPQTRGILLGEARFPGPPPNIAAFLSAKAQERLAADSNFLLPSTPASSSVSHMIEAPRLDPATARSALQGHTPFITNPAKQERYLTYLNSQLDSSFDSPQRLIVPADLTREQYASELMEFSKSASIFRPMSAAIASRFTKASVSIMEHETKATSAVPGLRFPAPASASTSSEDSEERDLAGTEVIKELTTSQQAAKRGNFGHWTRKTESWAPERLLCKRFGVPEPPVFRQSRNLGSNTQHSTAEGPDPEEDPHPFYGSTQSAKAKRKSGIKLDAHWEKNKHHLMALAAAGSTPLSFDAQSSFRESASDKDVNDNEENVIGMGDDERQGKDTLTYTKPGMDLFRAIFASDEESAGGKPGVETKPKMQDPTSSSGVVFQAKAKRKDVHDEARKVAAKSKRKKPQSSKKSLLTFDLDDQVDEGIGTKKINKTKKSLLTFDPDDQGDMDGAKRKGRALQTDAASERLYLTSDNRGDSSVGSVVLDEPKSIKPKGRMRASDLF
ncbi:uncharacterized protein MEPE_01129 [Melanopsichium pennsylvanicum]|uniref:G-patch domain-containing protein n=2 Tax=Melanopsichium pennsylvanicum TaxID=63383 RepID=A0AAJ5C3D8_9BASI|nr:rna binding protein [Melanopsichium pennsylvanicum 4]SNX82423.1 uncharacterized protein MEPE_01129 [Melanopsichium pennsylvanicum]